MESITNFEMSATESAIDAKESLRRESNNGYGTGEQSLMNLLLRQMHRMWDGSA